MSISRVFWLRAAAAFIAAALLLTVVFFSRKNAVKPSPDVATPQLAIEQLNCKSLYANPIARAYLASIKSPLLMPEDVDFAAAAQDPALWRRLDRKFHFDAVLLTGDPLQYRPLLQHLRGATDWPLVYLDHTSFIFKRSPARAWEPADLENLHRRFAPLPRPQRVDCLLQIAIKLLAIKHNQPAKQYLDEARGLDPKSPSVHVETAIYHIAIGELPAALSEADEALRLDKTFRPALETKAQILFLLRHYNEAYATSSELVKSAPDDPAALFLHAKIAHEAHAYSSEITTLKHIIDLVPGNQSVTSYRIFLGQAYAVNGDAKPALDEFEKALSSTDVTPAQRTLIENSMQIIRKKM